jgi:N-ethylmaleimide reductase
LDKFGLAYLHLFHFGDEALLADLRQLWSKPLVLLRPQRTLETLGADVEAGRADMVAIGRWALANPDFTARLKVGAPLNEPDPNTFYGGGAAGYTDYPRYHAVQTV